MTPTPFCGMLWFYPAFRLASAVSAGDALPVELTLYPKEQNAEPNSATLKEGKTVMVKHALPCLALGAGMGTLGTGSGIAAPIDPPTYTLSEVNPQPIVLGVGVVAGTLLLCERGRYTDKQRWNLELRE